jgi:hypothetical protein
MSSTCRRSARRMSKTRCRRGQSKRTCRSKRLGAGMGTGATVSCKDAGRRRRLLLTRISLYGYTMVEVYGTDKSSGLTYAYTLGLPRELGHPELAVCGLSSTASVEMVTSVVALLYDAPLLEGRVNAPARQRPLWIAPLPPESVESRLGLAGWWRREHHDGAPAAAKQIIVCDSAGRFPWERGCRPGHGREQSLLLPQITVREPNSTVTDQPGGANATGL